MTEPTAADRTRAEKLLHQLTKPMFVWRMAGGRLRTGMQHDLSYENALDEVHRLLQEYVSDVTGLPPQNVVRHEFVCTAPRTTCQRCHGRLVWNGTRLQHHGSQGFVKDRHEPVQTLGNLRHYDCAKQTWIVVRPNDTEEMILGRLVLSGWSLREDGRVLCPSCDSKEK